MNSYKSMTEIGKDLGISSHRVGKLLKELGLRNQEGQPTRVAFQKKLVEQRDSTNPDTYYYVWDVDRVVPLLKAHLAPEQVK